MAKNNNKTTRQQHPHHDDDEIWIGLYEEGSCRSLKSPSACRSRDTHAHSGRELNSRRSLKMKCNIFTVLVGSLLATWFLATRYIFDMLNPNSKEISLLREKIRGNRYERKINVASMPLESIVLATSAPSHGTIMPSATVTPIDCNCSYDVHIFYYGWYGNPRYDKKWLHWNLTYFI